MAEIEIRHLGFAAYIKMQGGNLVRVEGRTFVFESDKSVQDWRREYNRSCCMRHDVLVCELRLLWNQTVAL